MSYLPGICGHKLLKLFPQPGPLASLEPAASLSDCLCSGAHLVPSPNPLGRGSKPWWLKVVQYPSVSPTSLTRLLEAFPTPQLILSWSLAQAVCCLGYHPSYPSSQTRNLCVWNAFQGSQRIPKA